ncbi:hypothetical protein [Geodermatophilus nigrescens]|uniref:Uncharacterized protein n=1 Tax=Geodermatophilus nigrescens TaxID=1070870 RepID=A0A1M5QV35_9ACTN|nr:hypothetical protein [Geodermatophilus nigrescens]SHH17962.1 hypothetical protein SAMN05444351_4197 [Geodermatophilus nigrescens]
MLWQVKSEAGVEVGAVTVGTEPPGFITTVALNGRLPADADLVVYVTTTFADSNMGFRQSDLQPGEVYVFGDSVPRAEFEEQDLNC